MPAGLMMKPGTWTIQSLVTVLDGAKPETVMSLDL